MMGLIMDVEITAGFIFGGELVRFVLVLCMFFGLRLELSFDFEIQFDWFWRRNLFIKVKAMVY